MIELFFAIAMFQEYKNQETTFLFDLNLCSHHPLNAAVFPINYRNMICEIIPR